MNEQLAVLIRLQDLDTRLDAIAEKRRQFPDLVEVARRPVQEAEAALAEIRQEAETLAKRRRDHELDLKGREERIEKLKARSGEIKTNKEYQAHLFEIELAQQEKGTVEERLLEMMDRGESLHKLVAERDTAVAQRRREFDAEQARLQREHDAMEAEASQLAADHERLAQQLSAGNRQKYDYLKATRKGLAVVALKSGTCQGCRLSLPPQLVADIRKNEKILTCTYCHRILYNPAAVEAIQA